MIKQNTLTELKERIRIEILKRSITADFTLTYDADTQRLNLQSDYFQTMPVIFKSLQLQDFSSSVRHLHQHQISTNETIDYEHYAIYLQVSVRYENFDRGTNGTTLFTVVARVSAETDNIEHFETF